MPSSRARDSRWATIAKYTLHDSASASAGRNACRTRAWLHRMMRPPIVVTPSHGMRVSGEIVPLLSAAISAGTFMNDPG